MGGKTLRTFRLAIAGLMIGMGAAAQAGDLLVAGSPLYDQATNTGLKGGSLPYAPGCGVNNSGTAVGSSEKYVSAGDKGSRAVRWDDSGTAAELGNVGTNTSGYTNAFAVAVNDLATAVGYSEKYASGSDVGSRALRWDASGTTAIELNNLGTSALGYTTAHAYAVNAAGTAAGDSSKYVSGGNMGSRAVRWDASGTVATELGNLGTSSTGYTDACAYAINTAGTIAGWSDKYVGGTDLGTPRSAMGCFGDCRHRTWQPGHFERQYWRHVRPSLRSKCRWHGCGMRG